MKERFRLLALKRVLTGAVLKMWQYPFPFSLGKISSGFVRKKTAVAVSGPKTSTMARMLMKDMSMVQSGRM